MKGSCRLRLHRMTGKGTRPLQNQCKGPHAQDLDHRVKVVALAHLEQVLGVEGGNRLWLLPIKSLGYKGPFNNADSLVSNSSLEEVKKES